MVHGVAKRIRGKLGHSFKPAHLVIGIVVKLSRINRKRSQQNISFEERQRRHGFVFGKSLGFAVKKIKRRLKLIDRTAIRERKTGNALTKGNTLCG